MATNKNALIRYRTIDKCLQNKQRKWTLQMLIDACSQALCEFEGKESNVSKRTVQLDIQLMRSDKLGYNAPIVVYNKKYYTYDNPDYSITDIPITESDMSVIMESVEMLKQFKDFSLFADLNGVLQKLEDKVYRERDNNSIIHLDSNKNLKGLKHLDVIYQAILKKIVLTLTYQSFKSEQPSEIIFTPYILKEYNNRWFAIGKVKDRRNIQNFALDRIHKINFCLSENYIKEEFNPDDYYKNTFGVTVLNDKSIADIIVKVDPSNAPYVLTKPIHHSQRLIETLPNKSIIISFRVHQNFEIIRQLLGFGESLEVIQPKGLRKTIHRKLKVAAGNYESEIEFKN